MAVAHPASAGQNLTDRLGQDAQAMRSSNPVRILKWVRTDNVAKFESPAPEGTANGERISEPKPLSSASATADSTTLGSVPEESVQMDPKA